jgi:hypothetical protein
MQPRFVEDVPHGRQEASPVVRTRDIETLQRVPRNHVWERPHATLVANLNDRLAPPLEQQA